MNTFHICIVPLCLLVLLTQHVGCDPGTLADISDRERQDTFSDFIQADAGTPKVRKKRFFLPALSIANFLGISPFSTPLIPSIDVVGRHLDFPPSSTRRQ